MYVIFKGPRSIYRSEMECTNVQGDIWGSGEAIQTEPGPKIGLLG